VQKEDHYSQGGEFFMLLKNKRVLTWGKVLVSGGPISLFRVAASDFFIAVRRREGWVDKKKQPVAVGSTQRASEWGGGGGTPHCELLN